ncbi:hypothetical protein L2E82_15577 [Cichorium intybus]|uniref:Uncharacterized protein n=1 Tax=Cichorium intybus TaxID=13427 RepID=A0ACB9F373_CICIN|nr:hypothetical protein L2E82_15577 [Cichorium intybus]
MRSSRFNKSLFNSRLKTLFSVASFLCLILYLLSSLFFSSSNTRISLHDDHSAFIPTSLDHIVFGIASTANAWSKRKEYVNMWWNPDKMRGCVFMDNDNFFDYDTTSPPICISNDTSMFQYTWHGGLRSAIRVARVVSETVALNHSNVRWFVFGDDDTLFFPENLVKTLSKYDHNLWYYIGSNSESYVQNRHFSFSMAYGGAGFAISYPLAKVLATVLDSCLERYAHLYGSDGRISSCLAELGVALTNEPGFHQMDLTGDAFGLLMTHPMRPLVSLHHPERLDPIFPHMTQSNALRHLYEAAKVDPHRILQQTICYDRWYSWTISISWGYAVEVFGVHVLLPDVLRVPVTFQPWMETRAFRTFFNFDMRQHHHEPCRRAVVFHLDKVYSTENGITSIYRIMEQQNCTFGMTSPRRIQEIKVYSQKLNLDLKQLQAPRRQCCDILPSSSKRLMEINIRTCHKDELVHKQP